jgi:hypothetical protein
MTISFISGGSVPLAADPTAKMDAWAGSVKQSLCIRRLAHPIFVD